METKELRFITTDDNCAIARDAWSRAYEYERILGKIEQYKPSSIHNTACGLGTIHIQFADELKRRFENVTNSDNRSRDTDDEPDDFVVYDILEKNDKKYDCVLCVSTLEHLEDTTIMDAFRNLLDQVNDGGHLLITFDYPQVDLHEFEKMLGVQCKKEGNILNGSNSVCKQDCRESLNVVVLDIQK